MEKFKETYLFFQISLNNVVLKINVAVSFYFLEAKLFFLYFLPFSYIPNQLAKFRNKFSKICWFVANTNTIYFFITKLIPLKYFCFEFQLLWFSSYFGINLVFNGCVTIAPFIWPPFICLLFHNSYFGNFYF